MRKILAATLASVFFTSLFATTAIAAPQQSDCAALNAAKGEGKFTGQISTPPGGSSMEVTYGDQTVVVHYSNSVKVCQGGQPASLDALTRGASVSVFGPLRRNGKNIEIDAARIFVAGPPRAPRPSPEPARVTPEPQTATKPGRDNYDAQPAMPSQEGQQSGPPTGIGAKSLSPISMRQNSLPNSVILSGGTHTETMQRLRIVRTYAFPDLRATPQVTLGEARLDFRPMLNNDKALFNVAQRLHQLPQHVEVKEDRSEVSEVEQGLVIYHVLTYRILPGKCADANARAQLARAGVGCFERASATDRVAEFSKPGAPRYVANPEKRQLAMSAFQRNSALAEADANKGLADLRKALASPSQRAAIAAQIGEAETARMSTLPDDQLKEEIINSSVQHFEETLFVPKLESASYARPQHTLTIAASPAEIDAVQKLLREGVPQNGASPSNFPKLLKVVPATPLHPVPSAPAGDKSADLDLGPYYFLTGFTIGHDYEWNWGATVTINWCVVGCSSTYGVQLNAGFNYGFGLRFPIQAEFKYRTVVHPNNSAEATVTATFNPIQGNIDDFFQAGLAADQMYDAKELVAQAGANAGFSINLPGLGVGDSFSVGVDFTDKLPSPFTGGHFPPPVPGTPGISSNITFYGIDLLGGLLNYGVVGGQLLPSVQVNLHSDKLQFTLNDEIQKRQTRLASNPQTVSLAVRPGGAGDESHFSIGNPVYNLGFSVTPGLTPNVFVDIDVWSDNWNWTVWFPQLEVDLPPQGIDFGCHAGTTCVLDFCPVYNPSTGQIRDVAKEADDADQILTRGGCNGLGVRPNGAPGNYLCPVKGGMFVLCKTMLSNAAVSSCGVLVPEQVDKALRYKGLCTGDNGAYVCSKDMMGLCDVYLKNQEILSCKQAK